MIAETFVFVLSFLLFISVGLVANMEFWQCTHRSSGSFIRCFGFVLFAVNDCVYIPEEAIERCSVNFKRNGKFIKIKIY